MGKISFLFKYIYFYFTAGDEHSLHSPFVFDLYSYAIKPKKQFYIFKKIEKLRDELLRSPQIINIKDYGAGSQIDNSSQREVKSIARNSEKSAHLAQLLFRIIEYLKPEIIFDLGTSFGITTIYEASSNKESFVYTFEGCPETAAIANNNFKKIGLTNIKLIEGNIDNTLPQKVNEVKKIDYVFFDANHRYEPTVRYFETCLLKTQDETIFIFDDIHWSKEMEQAWEYIKAHPEVTITIDLFFIGLVFFRKKQPKQHFVLKF